MFDLHAPKSEGGAVPDEHMTILWAVRHDADENPRVDGLRDVLLLEGARSVGVRTARKHGRMQTDLLVATHPCHEGRLCQLVDSHFKVLNIEQQIDHSMDTARGLIEAAQGEPMGQRMLRRLARRTAAALRAANQLLSSCRIIDDQDLDPRYRAELRQHRDLLLSRLAAIHDALRNRER